MVITIIMVAYNARSTIERALYSISHQSFSDFEVLIIDDGSTDGSEDVYSRWTYKDNRIKVYQQNHLGVSAARQKGIDLAQGEFIIHVDADDWVDSDFLSKLITQAKQTDADLTSCNYWEESEERKTIREQNPGEDADSTEMLRLLLNGYIGGSCCNKLIRASVCKTVQFFPSSIQFREDELFIAHILDRGIRISHVDEPLYHYWKATPGSLSKLPIARTYNDIKYLIVEFESLVKKYRFTEDTLFIRKREILSNAFVLREFQDLKTLFPETRQQIITTKTPYNWRRPRSFFLRWALMGYPHLASFLYRINAKIVTTFS